MCRKRSKTSWRPGLRSREPAARAGPTLPISRSRDDKTPQDFGIIIGFQLEVLFHVHSRTRTYTLHGDGVKSACNQNIRVHVYLESDVRTYKFIVLNLKYGL